MDNEYLLAAITDLGDKLEMTNKLLFNIDQKLENIMEHSSNIDANTDYIYSVKNLVDEVKTAIKK